MTAPYDQDAPFTPGDPRDWGHPARSGWVAHPSHPGWTYQVTVCPQPVRPLTARATAAAVLFMLTGVCLVIAAGTEIVRLIDRWLP